MYQRVLHMLTYVGTRVRHEGHASAAHGLDTYEAKSLFDAWKYEHITVAHQFGNVGSMTQHSNAGVREHRGSFSAYSGMNPPAMANVPPSRCAGDLSHT